MFQTVQRQDFFFAFIVQFENKIVGFLFAIYTNVMGRSPMVDGDNEA